LGCFTSISLAKLCTAFNRTPDDLAALREVPPAKPVVQLGRLLMYLKERLGRKTNRFKNLPLQIKIL
jgi:hypothetical protein